jgi:tungstate transport system permease protein
MSLLEATREAFQRLFALDVELWTIVGISLKVSITALLVATPFAVALGFYVASNRFPGRRAVILLLQGLLSFPTVVVGLILYLLLSRSGPLGAWHLLFTQDAMIAGQAIIAFPVLAAFTLAAVHGADPRLRETATSLGAGSLRSALTTLHEVRFAVIAAVLNGFGRVISEVGCSMMVGGNISGFTRNVPTAIALETSKGDFAQGIALGAVLMAFALVVTLLLGVVQPESGSK